MFDELYRKTWWQSITEMIEQNLLTAGEHYITEGKKILINFPSVYSLVIDYLVDTKQGKESIVPPCTMRKALLTDDKYLFSLRKRLSNETNVRVMTFAWSQVGENEKNSKKFCTTMFFSGKPLNALEHLEQTEQY